MSPTSAPFSTSPEIQSLTAAVSSRLSLLVASLASRTAWPESEARPQTSATSGPSVGECFATYDPASRSSRTSPGCSLLSQDFFSTAFCQTWPRFGTLANGKLYQQPTVLGLRIAASASGSSASMNWPTATASDAHTDNLASTQQKDGSMHSVTLPQAVTRDWPTPTSRDHKDGTAESCANVPDNALLGRVIHRFPGPPRTASGPPVPASDSTSGNPPASSGKLNPSWVETLMGLPMGWTQLPTKFTKPRKGTP